MLLLGRRKNESITIGPDITITVCRINGGAVRLGIDAPKELAIHRTQPNDIARPRGARSGKRE